MLVFEPSGDYLFWPPLLLSRGLRQWHAERNVRLIRRGFLEPVLATLPGAIVSCRHRFLIPRSAIRRWPALDGIDRWLSRSESRWLERLAANVSFEVTKARA